MEKKYSSEEDKKVGKLYLPNKSNRLKKRSEFLNLRNKCRTFHGKFVIVNIDKSSDLTKYGLTVSKKIGNAVNRNKIKRRLRNIINDAVKNVNLKFNYSYLVIAKPTMLNKEYTIMKETLFSDLERIR